MNMDKCPKCGRYTLEPSMSEGSIKCYNRECRFEKSTNVGEYMQQHNDLPRLAKALQFNGYS